LHARLDGDTADLSGKANLGGGPLTVSGTAWLSPQPRVELAVEGGPHRLTYPPSLTATVSEQLSLQVEAGRLQVGGTVRVQEGEVILEQLPEGSVDISPDVVVVDYRGEAAEQKAALATAIDLQLLIRDRFKLRARYLDATVGGELHLVQNPGRPLQMYGDLQPQGGELRLMGQQLRIERGVIAFAGNPANPQLDLRAGRTIPGSDIKVGVGATGKLEEPVLEIYSDPPMSETEALSYLTRGRGLDAGAATDSSAVALSMGLSAVNNSGVLRELEKLPGLRNVTVGAETTEEGTTATVSGYLGDKLYLSYGTGLYEPITVLTARLYLQTRLWVEMVSSLENSLDIYYSFDIE
jgi:translocation and assembly module TamB